MSDGNLLTLDQNTSPALTEGSRRALVTQINHKAAVTAGVQALAQNALNSGDIEGVLEDIADITAVLTAELRKLAIIVGEFKAAHIA